MTDSTTIPQLNLFTSHRRHQSPTRDIVDFHNYKLSRYKAQKLDNISINRVSKTYKNIPSVPIPVPVPIAIPVQPIIQPYISTLPPSYPIHSMHPIHPIGRQFIHAPTTYVDYAQQYLAGKRLSILPQETARFENQRSYQNSKRNNINTGKYSCDCQSHSPHKSYNQNINKNVYLQNNNNRNTTQIIKPVIPKKQPQQPKIIINPPIIPHKHPQNEIKKDPYIIQTQRDQKNKYTRQQGQIFTQVIQNYSSYSQQQKKKPIPAPSPTIQIKHDEQTQTQQQKKKTQNQNRSSVLVQKFMRTIPVTLDAQSFKILITKRIQQFNSIKINFQDTPVYDLQIQDLDELRKKYIQQSSDLLARLNELAGDRVGLTMLYKTVRSTKQEKRMHWPDI